MRRISRALAPLALLLYVAPSARAGMIVSVPASPFTGPTQVKPGWGTSQGGYRPYDTSLNLAFQGNGFAKAAVARDLIPGYGNIHQEEFANDGFYGNGASWIGNSGGSWLKIDLGQVALIDSIIFGRDRISGFDDRDPGQFTVAVAVADNVYANGDDSNDGAEYTRVFDSTMAGYSGVVNGTESLRAIFSATVSARFVKMTFSSGGTAIDEVEIRAAAVPSAVPEPSSLISAALGLLGLAGYAGWRRVRPAKPAR